MSGSESDYQVEEYIKPTVKRSTYNNDDTYLSEGNTSDSDDKSGESDQEIIEDLPNNTNKTNKNNNDDEEDKVNSVNGSQCVLSKESPKQRKTTGFQKKHTSEEIVKTNSRFILYISNLSSDTTRTMLEDFFGDAGNIKSVRIPKKRLSNFAFVEMKDLEGYKNGLKFDGKELDGKRIKVQQGSKNKKHISNKSKMQKKKKIQIFEKKLQSRLLLKKT